MKNQTKIRTERIYGVWNFRFFFSQIDHFSHLKADKSGFIGVIGTTK